MGNRKRPKKIGDTLWLCLKKKREWSQSAEEVLQTPGVEDSVEEKWSETVIVEEDVMKTVDVEHAVQEEVLETPGVDGLKPSETVGVEEAVLETQGVAGLNPSETVGDEHVAEKAVVETPGVDGLKPSEISTSRTEMGNGKKRKQIGVEDSVGKEVLKTVGVEDSVEEEDPETPGVDEDSVGVEHVVEEAVLETPDVDGLKSSETVGVEHVVEEAVLGTPGVDGLNPSETSTSRTEMGNGKKRKQIGDTLWLCLTKKSEWSQCAETNQEQTPGVEEEVSVTVGVEVSVEEEVPEILLETPCVEAVVEEEVLKTPGVEEEVLETPVTEHVVEEEVLETPVTEHVVEEEVLKTPVVEEEELETPDIEHVVEEEVLKTPGVEEEVMETPVIEHVVEEEVLKTPVVEEEEFKTPDIEHVVEGEVLKTPVVEEEELETPGVEDSDEDSVDDSVEDPVEDSVEGKSRRLTIVECLLFPLAELVKPPLQRKNPVEHPEEQLILVPWCWDARLPEQLFNAGFWKITSVRDHTSFIKHNSAVPEARKQPKIKWLITDFTAIQLPNEMFDVVVDERLDFLMKWEGEDGKLIGNLYLYEAERLLKDGGKYICVTGFHALDILLPRFRFGWEMSLHTFTEDYELKLLVAAVKSDPNTMYDIALNLGECDDVKGQRLVCEAAEKEKNIRSLSTNAPCTLKDVINGARGNITQLVPGRRINLILGEPGVSRGKMSFPYTCVLLDSEQVSECFIYHYGLYVVPKSRAQDEEFTSEEEQWHVIESLKTARLLMVFLDSSNSMEDIFDDLIPFMEQLAPGYVDHGHTNIKCLVAGDGIKEREIVSQYTSLSSGPVVVEDVTFLDIPMSDNAYRGRTFRRLIYIRTANRVQSEALLSRKESTGKGKTKKQKASSSEMEVVHNYLASEYHNGIIWGMPLIASHLNICNPQSKRRKKRNANTFANPSKVVILGLGAGLLPMYMKTNRPSLRIEVVDSDPNVLTAARRYFGFKEDDLLKVHITDDMIEFVKETAEDKSSCSVDILVVDVNSFDTSSGLTCPPESFVEESFLLAAKSSLSDRGLFVMNLISRSPSVRKEVHLRLKKIFNYIFRLELEEDVSEVLFAFKAWVPTEKEQFSGVVKVHGSSRPLELMKL